MAFTLEQKREYNKLRYQAKNGIKPELSQKQGIENAPESNLRPEQIKTQTLRPSN